ncbi:MAG: tripartite tricarboxylate transporter TctB family protein [Deltaproteobacteria bacterium]|nr:tripartite tricarboxylate transporter TctB family protein [Deltaproteobacteria bacterium]
MNKRRELAAFANRNATLVAGLFFLIFLSAVLMARDWYFTAKLFPFFAGIPGLVLAAIQVWREATGWEARNSESGVQMDEVYDETIVSSVRRQRTTRFLLWVTATALGVWFVGLPLALTLSLAIWTRFEGGESWLMALCMGAGTFLVVWGVFTKMFGLAWPPGQLFFLLDMPHFLA